jgi:hypothetical protein
MLQKFFSHLLTKKRSPRFSLCLQLVWIFILLHFVLQSHISRLEQLDQYFQDISWKFCAAELDITTSSARNRRTEWANRSAAASRRSTQRLQRMELCKVGAAMQKAEFGTSSLQWPLHYVQIG